MNKIVEEFREYYNVFQVTRKNGLFSDLAFPVNQPYTVMELATLLLRSEKRVLIDSFLQHAAAALELSSTVLWVGTDPKVFGYDLHNNIVANPPAEHKLPDSYLFDYNFEGVVHECPYKSEEEMFDVDVIIDAIKRTV
jgi:hypothetical protein